LDSSVVTSGVLLLTSSYRGDRHVVDIGVSVDCYRSLTIGPLRELTFKELHDDSSHL
jgi:hypothetical protein